MRKKSRLEKTIRFGHFCKPVPKTRNRLFPQPPSKSYLSFCFSTEIKFCAQFGVTWFGAVLPLSVGDAALDSCRQANPILVEADPALAHCGKVHRWQVTFSAIAPEVLFAHNPPALCCHQELAALS